MKSLHAADCAPLCKLQCNVTGLKAGQADVEQAAAAAATLVDASAFASGKDFLLTNRRTFPDCAALGCAAKTLDWVLWVERSSICQS